MTTAKLTYRILMFVLSYFIDVLWANFLLARDLLNPRKQFYPQLIEIPLSVRSPGRVYLLANLVTYTPGTLTVDFDESKDVLLVHLLQGGDASTVHDKIKKKYEAFIMEVWP